MRATAGITAFVVERTMKHASTVPPPAAAPATRFAETSPPRCRRRCFSFFCLSFSLRKAFPLSLPAPRPSPTRLFLLRLLPLLSWAFVRRSSTATDAAFTANLDFLRAPSTPKPSAAAVAAEIAVTTGTRLCSSTRRSASGDDDGSAACCCDLDFELELDLCSDFD